MTSEIKTICEDLQGKFVVLDGPDGAGKSTQLQLLAEALLRGGVDVVTSRDPGGTEIGDRVRSVLLDYDLSDMDAHCEALLFMASRAQLVAEVIRPALGGNKTVLCDRFVTSTCAYQGAAGYDPKRVLELARYAIEECWPDLTIMIDLEVEEGFARIGRGPQPGGMPHEPATAEATPPDGGRLDAMEVRSIEFHHRVRQMFLSVHEYYPTPVVTVDGRGDVEQVHRSVLEAIGCVAR